MSIVIVTKRCYLACESITSVTVQESEITDENDDSWRPRKWWQKRKIDELKGIPPKFTVEIAYTAIQNQTLQSSSKNYSVREDVLTVDIFGEKQAYALYTEIVKEIRDQSQDSLFLDNLIEKVLADVTD